jgi:uncharacterized membrane protein
MARHELRRLLACMVATAVAACSGSTIDNGAGNAVTAAAAAPAARNDAANAATADTNAAATAAPCQANGTEPFWALTIAGGQMIYQPMEGAAVVEPLPAPIPIPEGYRYQGTRLAVEVVRTGCDNGMSDQNFADTVRVTVGGETRNGCGGERAH